MRGRGASEPSTLRNPAPSCLFRREPHQCSTQDHHIIPSRGPRPPHTSPLHTFHLSSYTPFPRTTTTSVFPGRKPIQWRSRCYTVRARARIRHSDHPHQQLKPPLAPPQMNLKRRRASSGTPDESRLYPLMWVAYQSATSHFPKARGPVGGGDALAVAAGALWGVALHIT